jgi:hypothetical protein
MVGLGEGILRKGLGHEGVGLGLGGLSIEGHVGVVWLGLCVRLNLCWCLVV